MDDAGLGRLAERDYQVWVEGFAGTPGVTVRRSDVLVRRADIRHEYLTAVFGAWLRPEDADDRIRAVIDDLSADGRPFYWTVWPSDTPPDLVDRLIAIGFRDDGSGPLMARSLTDPTGLDEPPPDGLEIRRATTRPEIDLVAAMALGAVEADEPGVSVFGDTIARVATETPERLRLFGGWLDGRVVAASGLFTGTGVAGIYSVATDDAHRGRGFGRALTAAALRAGRDLGLDVAVLMSSDLGLPVYRRLGFREVATVRFLRWPGGLSSDADGVPYGS